MAVINSPYVGNARGKLGEGVFYRSKGNTIARAYNSAPTNRRTVSQQSQRSVFSSAVKFFSRGVQNLFVFAFENKKPQESDYNAFMRYNAKRGIYFGPDQNDNDVYPALGAFVMTRGSLGTFNQVFSEVGPNIYFDLPTTGITTTSWASVSQALVDAGFVMQGDFITFCFINTNSRAGSDSQPVIIGTTVPQWTLRQVAVDVSSSDTVASLGLVATAAGGGRLVLSMANLQTSPVIIQAGCVVVSRVQNGFVRVSNTDLQLNDAADLALTYGRSISWERIVLNAWGAERESILQGGISENSPSGGQVYRLLRSFEFPVSNQSLYNQYIQIIPAISLSQLALGLVMTIDGGEVAELDIDETGYGLKVSTGGDTFGSWVPDANVLGRFVYSGEQIPGPTWVSIEFEG